MAVVDIFEAKISLDDLQEQLRPQGFRVVADHQLKLVKVERYVQRFYEIAADRTTYQSAFEALEAEYFDLFGVNKYSSFESFTRSAAIRRVRAKK